MIRFNNVSFVYPDGSSALDSVSFEIKQGLRTVLLGRNGSGKSTLLQLCNGLLQPTSGNLLYQDALYRYDRKSLMQLRSKVGMVFQETENQLFSASVEQDVSFGPMNLKMEISKVREVVEKALIKTGCDHFRHKPTHYLSGGEKKRVALAGVAVMNPDLICADEPIAHLDALGCDALVELFNQLHTEGTSFFISTHDLHFARSWFDYAVILDSGKILAQGKANDILSNASLLKKAGLLSRWMGMEQNAAFQTKDFC